MSAAYFPYHSETNATDTVPYGRKRTCWKKNYSTGRIHLSVAYQLSSHIGIHVFDLFQTMAKLWNRVSSPAPFATSKDFINLSNKRKNSVCRRANRVASSSVPWSLTLDTENSCLWCVEPKVDDASAIDDHFWRRKSSNVFSFLRSSELFTYGNVRFQELRFKVEKRFAIERQM